MQLDLLSAQCHQIRPVLVNFQVENVLQCDYIIMCDTSFEDSLMLNWILKCIQHCQTFYKTTPCTRETNILLDQQTVLFYFSFVLFLWKRAVQLLRDCSRVEFKRSLPLIKKKIKVPPSSFCGKDRDSHSLHLPPAPLKSKDMLANCSCFLYRSLRTLRACLEVGGFTSAAIALFMNFSSALMLPGL